MARVLTMFWVVAKFRADLFSNTHFDLSGLSSSAKRIT